MALVELLVPFCLVVVGTLLRRLVLPSEYAVLPRVRYVHHSVAKARTAKWVRRDPVRLLRTPPPGLVHGDSVHHLLMVILFTVDRRVRGWHCCEGCAAD